MCPAECSPAFARVMIAYRTRGGTIVRWTLKETFNAATPYTFQLQAGRTTNQLAGDWTNVGAPTSLYTVTDPNQQSFHTPLDAFYRVQLTCTAGTFVSDPVAAAGSLSYKDWRIVSDLIRRAEHDSRDWQQGYLLKTRGVGAPCPRCLDPQTGNPRDPNCPVCKGTGKACPYYYPQACMPVLIHTFPAFGAQIDQENGRGTVEDTEHGGRILFPAQLATDDIWVARDTDERYIIRTIKPTDTWKGLWIVADISLHLLPKKDSIYQVDIPGQLSNLAA